MPKLPVVKARELIKVLKKKGFIHARTKGSHYIFLHPDKKITVSLPIHKNKDLGRGITKQILEDAKISEEELLKLV